MKGKKKAFLLSFLSLLMSVSMLIGTTFAWFTDTASTAVNKIQAGNLDITAEYKIPNEDGTLGTEWEDLEGAESLFSSNLWEPGHTECAVIRIKNAGTLALKYKVRVDVVSETGSINVAGQQFKLSDYLKYGVEYFTSAPSIDRVQAETLATTALGAYVSDVRGLEVGADYDYMTLAITMPSTVGNEANYDKQYNAPSIGLGVTIAATQKSSESDSFGSDYDNGATFPAPTFTTTTNVVFPVKNTATLAQDATKVTVELKANTATSGEIRLGLVEVPAGRVADTEQPVTVELKPATTQQESNFGSVATGKEAKYYDISVSNLQSGSDKITVTLQLDKGLTDVVIKHYNGTDVETIEGATYDPVTGIVTFETDSFSPYAVEYKSKKVAEVGGVYYSSLVDAVNAAKANGGTVVLLDNAEGNGIKAGNGDNFTIDFNGFTYNVTGDLVGSSGTVNQAAQLLKGATVTFKNGTFTSTKARMIIQNYCNLTLIDMTIDGTRSEKTISYVVSNNCGNVTITGNTNILASEGKFAFDAYYWPNGGYTEGVRVTIDENMTGLIRGKIEFGDDGTDLTGAADPKKHSIAIKGGKFSSNPSDYVAEGYKAKLNGDWYEILFTKPLATVGGETFALDTTDGLAAVLAMPTGSDIVISGDLELNDPITFANPVNISLEGANITYTSDTCTQRYLITVQNGSIFNMDAYSSIVLNGDADTQNTNRDWRAVYSKGIFKSENIAGTIVVNNAKGRGIYGANGVEIENYSGSVVFNNSNGANRYLYGIVADSGDVNIENFTGNIKIDYGRGNTGIGVVAIKGNIYIENYTGNIDVQTNTSHNAFGIYAYNNVTIGDLSGSIYTRGGSGSGYGVCAVNGDVAIAGISGSISGNSFNTVMTNSQWDARAIYAKGSIYGSKDGENYTPVQVTGTLSSTVSRTAAFTVQAGEKLYMDIKAGAVISAQSSYQYGIAPLEGDNWGGGAVNFVAKELHVTFEEGSNVTAVSQTKNGTPVDSLCTASQLSSEAATLIIEIAKGKVKANEYIAKMSEAAKAEFANWDEIIAYIDSLE